MKKNIPEFVEVEGSTIEEAIKKATEFFSVSREEMTIKIVCDEKKGLFGMEGAKPAKIRVKIKKNDNG